MSHYTLRIRCGRKTSWKPAIPKARTFRIESWARLDILDVEYERRNCYTCCTSCWNSDCGQGRSGPPSLQPRRNTRRNNLVRTVYFLFRLRADIAPPSGRHISPCFRDYRGLGKALVPRTRIPLLCATLRDRVRPTKGAERMGYG